MMSSKVSGIRLKQQDSSDLGKPDKEIVESELLSTSVWFFRREPTQPRQGFPPLGPKTREKIQVLLPLADWSIHQIKLLGFSFQNHISLDSLYLFSYICSAMNDQKMKRKIGRRIQKDVIAISGHNYRLFGLGAVIILAGYWALAQPPVNGFLTLTLAPILLVIGYCVLIPLAIILNKKSKETKT